MSTKKPKTKAEKEWMDLVAQLGCLICGQPAQLHHATGNKSMSQKNSNYDVLPLCVLHHTSGGHGIAIHAGVKTWEANFGSQKDLLEQVKKEVQQLKENII